MKKISFVIFLLFGACCILSWKITSLKKKPKVKFRVTGSIMQTSSYCGGAVPTAELLKKIRTPAGIPFGKLYIKETLSNEEGARIIDTIYADANGKFSINLPAGSYCLIEEWKAKPFSLPPNTKYKTVDPICYRNRYNACDYQITVTDKNIEDLKFIFHRSCFFNQPCISYKGPLPHAAPIQ